MGLFDNIKKSIDNAANNVKSGSGSNKSVDIVFSKTPDTYEEFLALPEAKLSTPFDTAALTVLAFCYYPQNKDLSLRMLQYLKGPGGLSEYQKSFFKERMSQYDYVPRSYFKGATPQNDYLPSEPLTVTVKENPYSYANENIARLFVTSGGADSDRYMDMKLAKDGKWYLWEQYILVGIREPESSNPWA